MKKAMMAAAAVIIVAALACGVETMPENNGNNKTVDPFSYDAVTGMPEVPPVETLEDVSAPAAAPPPAPSTIVVPAVKETIKIEPINYFDVWPTLFANVGTVGNVRVWPKGRRIFVNAAGIGPPPQIGVSGNSPNQDYIMKIDNMMAHLNVLAGPAGLQNVQAYVMLVADQLPIMVVSLEALSSIAANESINKTVIVPVNYYASQNTRVSLVVYLQYAGAAAAVDARMTAEYNGYIYKQDGQIESGTDYVPPATLIEWNRLLTEYINW